jgi:hypothetical protein
MSYEIFPLEGVNTIKFGMSVNDVRGRMSGDFEVFRRAGAFEPAMLDHPSDFYQDAGVFCYYDKSGHLDAIEFARRARPLLGGVDIFELSIGEATALLAKLDPEVDVHYEGAISYALSLAVWSPEASDDQNAPLQSILTGRAGYYDEDVTELQ